MDIPQGFYSFSTHAGIKPSSLKDLSIIWIPKGARVWGFFTQNSIKGHPVKMTKEHLKKRPRLKKALLLLSGNANVLTGKEGREDQEKLIKKVAKELSLKKEEILTAATGIIGRRLPTEKILSSLEGISSYFKPLDPYQVASSIMTTDKKPKFFSLKIPKSSSYLTVIGKGAGMIAPNLATMLIFYFTDAKISSPFFYRDFYQLIDQTYNQLSIDSDTSTSDMVLLFSSSLYKVSYRLFKRTLEEATSLMISSLLEDAEGATKSLYVEVVGAKTSKEAKKIARSIVESPLVKTMIYQGDPNWGRIYMAIGKTGIPVEEEKIEIFYQKNSQEWKKLDPSSTEDFQESLKKKEIFWRIYLHRGKASSKAYGCDLTEEYVRINAYYTT